MKLIPLFLFFALTTKCLLSQSTVVNFEDNTKIEYILIKNHFDDINPLTLKVVPFSSSPRIEGDYFVDHKYKLKASLGYTFTFNHVVDIGGTYFISSKSKMMSQRIVVGFKSDFRYATDIDLEKKKYFGFNAGYVFNSNILYKAGYQAHGIYLGVCLFGGKYAKLFVPANNYNRMRHRKIREQFYFSYNANFIFYPYANFKGNDSGYDIYEPINADNYYSFRVYSEGGYKYVFYKFGVNIHSEKEIRNIFLLPVFFEVGSTF